MAISYGQKLMENSWIFLLRLPWDISVRVEAIILLSTYVLAAIAGLLFCFSLFLVIFRICCHIFDK